MIGAVVATFGWADNRPTATVQSIRIIASALSIVGLAGFIALHFRRDRVPDYLQYCSTVFFDRNGFCFSFEPIVMSESCYIRILFQNRFERRCIAQIALRPAEVFGTFARDDFSGIAVSLDCPAAGFGMLLAPIAIPNKCQGTRQTFQVGATIIYPDGKGRMLRFGSDRSVTVRSNADFCNPFYRRLTIAAALTGGILISRPARVTFLLPDNVLQHAPKENVISQKIIWQLGDDSILPSDFTKFQYK